MHECLLFASIPSNQHDHILKILAGISAMQPIPIKEHHLIFKPNRTSASLPVSLPGRTAAVQPGSKTGSTAPKPVPASQDLFYLQLIGDLTKTRKRAAGFEQVDHEEDDQDDEKIGYSRPEVTVFNDDSQTQNGQDVSMPDAHLTNDASSYPYSNHPWTLSFKSLPDVRAGRTGNSRLASSITLKNGNPRQFVEALGYSYMTSYVTSGHRFVHGSTDIRLYKTYPLANPLPKPGHDRRGMNEVPHVPDGKELENIPQLDPAGGSMLEATVFVRDGANADWMKEAMRELESLQTTLHGIVRLEPVERLSLDTRIRSAPIAAKVSR